MVKDQIKRMGVALDLTSKDQETLQYLGYLAQLFQPETLFGLHIVPVWDIGDFFKVDIRNPFQPAAPALGKVYDMLSQEMTDFAQYPKEKMKIDIQEGRPYQKLRYMVEKDEIQLLVVGQKSSTTGSGITSRRLARHIKSDLLFVPSVERLPIKKILWAVDFSEYAYHAYTMAHKLREVLAGQEKIIGLHIVDIPPFQQYGERGTYEYAISSLPVAARRRCEDFMTKHKINQEEIEMSIHLSAGRNVADDILSHAQKMEADIIFIGAVGHSGLENYFLGSVTEALITQNDQIPIWVVR